MPHVSVCDSHNSLPQSEHCVLAVLEQVRPTTSAEFLISITSQCSGMKVSFTPRLSQLPKMGSEVSLQLRVLRLGLLQDGDVGVGVFAEGEEIWAPVPYCLDSCRRTTSESEWPRNIPSFFPSGDQWNESICSELKLVIRCPAEPSSGCTQTLSTPFSRMI
jgi:hypothetical protein